MPGVLSDSDSHNRGVRYYAAYAAGDVLSRRCLFWIGYSVIAILTGPITTHMSSAFQKRHWQRRNVRSASKASMNIARNIVNRRQ